MILSRSVLLVGVLAFVLLGAGCKKAQTDKPVTAPNADETSAEVTAVQAPKDAWKEFTDASAQTSGLRDVSFDRQGGRVGIRVPESWREEGAVWRPDEGKLNHVRLAHFSNDGPSTAWESQKALGVHEVVQAEERGGTYLLMVNHPGLKSTILKAFIPDPKLPGEAYYFFECRASYEGDRSQVWKACKAAFESLKIE